MYTTTSIALSSFLIQVHRQVRLDNNRRTCVKVSGFECVTRTRTRTRSDELPFKFVMCWLVGWLGVCDEFEGMNIKIGVVYMEWCSWSRAVQVCEVLLTRWSTMILTGLAWDHPYVYISEQKKKLHIPTSIPQSLVLITSRNPDNQVIKLISLSLA